MLHVLEGMHTALLWIKQRLLKHQVYTHYNHNSLVVKVAMIIEIVIIVVLSLLVIIMIILPVILPVMIIPVILIPVIILLVIILLCEYNYWCITK